MVADEIKKAEVYYGLGKKIKTALTFLRENDFSEMKDGRYDIENDKIFAVVSRYGTKPAAEGRWEAHKKYIDVQYVAEGIEKIGYAPVNSLVRSEEYSEEKDIMFLTGNGEYLTAGKGTFLIFYPEEGHMPGLNPENDRQNILKVVVKVIAD